MRRVWYLLLRCVQAFLDQGNLAILVPTKRVAMRVGLLLLSYLLHWRLFRRSGNEWRRAVLQAAVLWTVLLIGFTELLSVGSLFTRGWLTLAWASACAIEIGLLLRLRPHATNRPSSGPDGGLSGAERVLLGLAGVLAASTGILALIAPPNVWDAMEYHLPRVMLWVSNHNVNYFPTPDYAQLVFGPASEYAMAHLYLLWGGDRLVNLVNFFCFLGCVLAASLIARQFGAGIRGQAFTALFVATIPEAVLEASGPMNTAGGAFWIVTATYFTLAANFEEGWGSTVLAGISVGIAVLTKGTAYLYLPFVLLACWWLGSPAARRRMLRRLPALALIVLGLNAAQFARAYEFTGSPLGMPFPEGGPQLHWMCDHITPVGVVANTVRNVGLHLETPSSTVNRRIDEAMRGLIRRMGQDPDDPSSIWPGLPFLTNRRSLHEVYAGNPLQLALIVIACLALIVNIRQLADSGMRWYVAGAIASFVLFSGMLRWQIWNSRHHLPLFVLFAPIVGLAVERLLSDRAGIVLGGVLLISCAPFIYSNKLRSFIPWHQVVDIYRPRADLYFADMHMEMAPAIRMLADRVLATGCKDVGIRAYLPVPERLIEHSPESFFVYPLLALLRVDGNRMRVRYIEIQNPSAKYARSRDRVPPCAVVCLDCAEHPGALPRYSGAHALVQPIRKNDLIVFLPDRGTSGFRASDSATGKN